MFLEEIWRKGLWGGVRECCHMREDEETRKIYSRGEASLKAVGEQGNGGGLILGLSVGPKGHRESDFSPAEGKT